jgi:hypothetical protein
VRVADPGDEEFEEAQPGRIAGGGDEGWSGGQAGWGGADQGHGRMQIIDNVFYPSFSSKIQPLDALLHSTQNREIVKSWNRKRSIW